MLPKPSAFSSVLLPFTLLLVAVSSIVQGQSCGTATSCGSCLNLVGCGWCSTSFPNGGTCDQGNANGPTTTSCTGTWYFYNCPNPTTPSPSGNTPPLIRNGSWLSVAASPNRRRFVDLSFNLAPTAPIAPAWSNTSIFGSTWHTPVVHGGVVFVLGSKLINQSTETFGAMVTAFDQQDGTYLASLVLFPEESDYYVSDMTLDPVSNLLLVQGNTDTAQHLVAVNTTNCYTTPHGGISACLEMAWSQQYPTQFNVGDQLTLTGGVPSPTEGLYYVPIRLSADAYETAIIGVDLQTGETVRNYSFVSVPGAVAVAALDGVAGEGLLLFSYSSGTVLGVYNASSGERLWNTTVPQQGFLPYSIQRYPVSTIVGLNLIVTEHPNPKPNSGNPTIQVNVFSREGTLLWTASSIIEFDPVTDGVETVWVAQQYSVLQYNLATGASGQTINVIPHQQADCTIRGESLIATPQYLLVPWSCGYPDGPRAMVSVFDIATSKLLMTVSLPGIALASGFGLAFQGGYLYATSMGSIYAFQLLA